MRSFGLISTMRLNLVVLVVLLASAVCRQQPAKELAPVVDSEGVMPHGDHTPRYGGTVWMHGDLHFEVVLSPSGEHRIYFSDASRVELPAAVGEGVTVVIHRSEEDTESLELKIDEFGEAWQTSGMPVEELDATAVVRFVYENEPYEIELPFIAAVLDPAAPDPHKMP